MVQKRREYLTVLALGATGVLAGCTGAGDDDEREPVNDDNGAEVEDVADDDSDEVETEEERAGEERAGEEGAGEEEDSLRQMDLSFGEAIEHPDGFRITPFEPDIVDSFERESFDGTETIEPENEQFVFIEIAIENSSNSTIETPNTLNFQAIVDGRQYERASLIGERPDDHERYPSLESLAPGSTVSGDVIFDTASGEAELFYSGRTEDFEQVEAIWS